MALKARLKSKFPARVVAGTGLTISRSGGTYTFGFGWGSSLSETTSIALADRDNVFVTTYNSETEAYGRMSVQTLFSDTAFKEPVVAATTANITLSGAQTIDGVSVVAGDRVLVKDQSTGADNGIYVASASSWSRATDFDSSSDVTSGTQVFVIGGTTNGGKGFQLSTANPITLGTTSISFAVAYPASAAALTKTDDTNVTLTLGGSPTTALLAATSITVGWSGQLAVSRGGTGLSSGTSGGVPYFSAAGTMASTAALNANGLMYGSGAGNGPGSTNSLTAGQIVVGTAATPTNVSVSGDVSLTSAGVATVVSASTAAAGKVELATDAEARTRTDTARALTPSNLAAMASFSAHKNGTDQTPVAAATEVKVTFGTEAWDTGSHYDTTNHRWTPPAGKVQISGRVFFSASNIVDQALYYVALFKNGSVARYGSMFAASGTTNGVGLTFVFLEDANGTDYYEIYAYGGGAGDKTIGGAAGATFFQGVQV